MQSNLIPVIRLHSLRIILIAILLSLIGHFILFFGLPLFSFSSAPEIADDLIIRTEIKAEPPKKIQMTQSPKKEAGITNSSTNSGLSLREGNRQAGRGK